MDLIDTHCHLHFPDFNHDQAQTIDRALAQGVCGMINVASDVQGSRDSVALAEKYPYIWATIGIHPHDAKEVTSQDYAVLVQLIHMSHKIVALGEIGLDYYRNLSSPEIQKQVFQQCLILAKQYTLPLVFHVRNAEQDFLTMLDTFLYPGARGVVHCFSGDYTFAQHILDKGLFISFTANITYKKADLLREVCQKVPLEKIMLETDAPFLAPQSRRGTRNEPAYVIEAAQAIAQLHKCSVEKVAEITTANARHVFQLE